METNPFSTNTTSSTDSSQSYDYANVKCAVSRQMLQAVLFCLILTIIVIVLIESHSNRNVYTSSVQSQQDSSASAQN